MKKLTINKIGVIPFANFFGLLGGIGGWIGGAVYAYITNVALKVTKGVTFEIK
jgi:hypothetical protein